MALSVLELIKRGMGGVKGTALDFHNLARNALYYLAALFLKF